MSVFDRSLMTRVKLLDHESKRGKGASEKGGGGGGGRSRLA